MLVTTIPCRMHPVPFRSRKLNYIGRRQYCDGRPHRNTSCCNHPPNNFLVFFNSVYFLFRQYVTYFSFFSFFSCNPFYRQCAYFLFRLDVITFCFFLFASRPFYAHISFLGNMSHSDHINSKLKVFQSLLLDKNEHVYTTVCAST